MEAPLQDLIDMLNGRATDEVPEARDLLIERGLAVVPSLVDRLGGLTSFGKLAAIEVFEALGDRRAGPGLEGLLQDDSHTVRAFAAGALGELGCTEAVPALMRLDHQMRAERERPEFAGPFMVRTALTQLGARVAVLPKLTGSLARSLTLAESTAESPYWPIPRLAEVINELAAHRQVVVHLRLWPIRTDGHVVWTMGAMFERRFDWSASWEDNISQSQETALRYVENIPPERESVAEIDWINEDDVR